MKVTRYSLNKWMIAIAIGFLGSGWGLALLTAPISRHTAPFALLAFGFLVLAYVDLRHGIYCELNADAGVFCRVNHFVIRKCLDVSEIAEIRYSPTWIVGGRNRSLFILDRKNGQIEMSNSGFRERDLAEIASKLRMANPRIEFDQDANELVQKYEHNRS